MPVGLMLLLQTMMAAGGVTTSAPPARPRVADAVGLIEGQVVKVDLSRDQLIVKVAGPRELVIAVDQSSTRVSRLGRAMGLADVRSGERVLVSCEDGEDGENGENGERGRCRARFIKVGTWKLPGPEPRKRAE